MCYLKGAEAASLWRASTLYETAPLTVGEVFSAAGKAIYGKNCNGNLNFFIADPASPHHGNTSFIICFFYCILLPILTPHS